MQFLMQVILHFIITFVLPLIILTFSYYWLEQYFNSGVRLKYKDFVKFYYINKSKWDLSDMKYSGKAFRFGPIGYIRFLLFKLSIFADGHKSRASEKRIKYNERTFLFISDVQNDLDNYMKEIEKLKTGV